MLAVMVAAVEWVTTRNKYDGGVDSGDNSSRTCGIKQ